MGDIIILFLLTITYMWYSFIFIIMISGLLVVAYTLYVIISASPILIMITLGFFLLALCTLNNEEPKK